MSIGGSEILFILLVVLLLFGSKRIPDVARMMGKGMREFRKATDEIKKEINEETREMSNDFNKIKKDLQG
jgi:sec-independent protein translocase protein TatA